MFNVINNAVNYLLVISLLGFLNNESVKYGKYFTFVSPISISFINKIAISKDLECFSSKSCHGLELEL